MLNKNDPLIGAVQEVMKKNQAEREAVRLVNEKFGITDRKALPHEKQGAWEAAYKQVLSEGVEGSIPTTPREKKLAAMHGNPNRITHGDKLKAVGAIEEAEAAPKTDPYAEGQASSISTVKKPMPKPTSVTPADQSALKNKIQSIMKEGAKVDRMVGHIKKSEMEAGKSAEEAETIAWKTANKRGMLKPRRKTVKEGFNSRHNSSVNASVQEQVVTEQEASQGQYTGSNWTTASQAYAQKKQSPNSMQTAERQRRAAETQASLAAQRQQSDNVAPRPQSSVGGDIAPRPQSSVALQRQQSGDVAPRPQSSVALQRQQSGDVAPRQQSSVALQRQQSGDVAPRPQGQASSQPAVRPNDTGRAGVPGTGNRLATPAATPASAVKKAAPAATQTARPAGGTKRPVTPVRKASTSGGLRTQKDANLLARAKAGGGQRLSTTFKSGGDRLNYLRARAQANK
jgi:hypothetical protein